MTRSFTGCSALVTGHASGIGAATAALLAESGARVVGVDVSRGQDVTSPAMWDALAGELADLDLAVVNAGISSAGAIADMDFATWRRTLAVNLDGAMLTLRAAMRAMIAHGRGGAIVVTASISGIKAEPGVGAYGASKAGVIQLARVAAKEGAPHGIRVNAIAPGGVDTPIWDQLDFFPAMVAEQGSREAAIDAMAKAATPLRRWASADEVARQIAFLLSDDAANITGAVLTADGGYSL
ncbi:SDR family NAD(P)-dependent oxidoreductase [Sphingopyxis sp.]|uniref:SDR family NAD(P)-dependent oxidoreductase n=1 Tax=Sphingopyxis sp. TaxID=1908224 RepID=UPI002D794A86|nr:SDR family NAD(P)-dependent oxidoreductase [Sphingopyxis sp.]HET6525814.1 SDR family NAD(P)-dependent oxidoreductase [Sphingopyxis sp.]